MKIITLIENTLGESAGNCLICEHGLSVFVQTDKYNILVDTGATGDFVKNAENLGVDLTKIDYLFLSHGHYDHTGGVLEFAKINKTAKIYMQRSATSDFKNGLGKHIGIDREILQLENLELISGNTKINDEIEIFSDISGRKYFPRGNFTLTVFKDGTWQQDDFSHEMAIRIKEEGGKTLLLSGCAHNGILNILDKYKALYNSYPDLCVSGFHMMKKDDIYDETDLEIIKATANELKNIPTKFYTGHCTHEIPYNIMKEIMPDNLEQIYTGFTIDVV